METMQVHADASASTARDAAASVDKLRRLIEASWGIKSAKLAELPARCLIFLATPISRRKLTGCSSLCSHSTRPAAPAATHFMPTLQSCGGLKSGLPSSAQRSCCSCSRAMGNYHASRGPACKDRRLRPAVLTLNPSLTTLPLLVRPERSHACRGSLSSCYGTR